MKRKPPKNQRAYPKGKPRLIEVTDRAEIRLLEDGQGDIGVPNLIAGPDSWYVIAAELKKWRALRNPPTSAVSGIDRNRNGAMSKCLRCGATSEWIQGRTPDELRAINGDQDRSAELERVLQRVQKALADTSPVLLEEPQESGKQGFDTCRWRR